MGHFHPTGPACQQTGELKAHEDCAENSGSVTDQPGTRCQGIHGTSDAGCNGSQLQRVVSIRVRTTPHLHGAG